MQEDTLNALIFDADAGSLEAQLNLILYYSNRDEDSFDFDKAEKWLNRAIKKGSTYAKFELANLYLEGRSDGLPLIEYESDRLRLLHEAAAEGHLEALYFLGCGYASGGAVKKDPKRSLALLKKAAEGGHQKARDLISQFPSGISPNQLAATGELFDDLALDASYEARRYHLFLEGAKLGVKACQIRVAEFLEKAGKLDEAEYWYELGESE